MSAFLFSGYRPSVGAAAAVVLTALIVWGFSAYAGYVQQTPYEPVSKAQVEWSAASSDRDTRNG